MRYTGPKCRLCRREGVKLFLKGEKCDSQKCTLVKRSMAPGDHPRGRGKPTEYARQLREKQKAKRIFGLSEKQFSNLFGFASGRDGATGDEMMKALELRLDNIVYRSGIVDARSQARQFISHGHFQLNGKKVKTPSIKVKVGDEISLSTAGKAQQFFAKRKIVKDHSPKWMDVNTKSFTIKVVEEPGKDDFENVVESRLVVEYYSRN